MGRNEEEGRGRGCTRKSSTDEEEEEEGEEDGPEGRGF